MMNDECCIVNGHDVVDDYHDDHHDGGNDNDGKQHQAAIALVRLVVVATVRWQ